MRTAKVEIFDNSMLQQFKDCPRKFYWRYIRHLSPITEQSYQAAFGSAGHEAYAKWYETGSAKEMDKAFTSSWLPFEGQDSTGKRSLMRGLLICEQYRSQFSSEPFTLLGPEYIEVGFVAELEHHLICGKIDLLIKWNLLTEGIIAMEHKFSSSKGYLCCEPNAQLDTYIWAASKLLREKVLGAYFNICYLTAKDMTKNEFIRELTYRSEDKLLEWERTTKYYINRIDEACSQGFWPRNTSHCGAYYRACEYTRLCKETCEEEWDDLIPLLYEENKWNPYPEARTIEVIK